MTAPRCILPGSYVFVTRSTTQRQFLLKPSEQANQAFKYCLALAAKKTGVRVLFVMVMSNHYHLGVYDPHARLPEFVRELNREVSRHHNAMYGRFENLFSSEKPSMVRLGAFEDLMDKLVYSLANACADHLVDQARHWPGVISLPHQLGKSELIQRPKTFFRTGGPSPACIELEYGIPENCPWDHVSYREHVAELLAEREHEHRHQRQAEGRRVLGRRAILKQAHTDVPSSSREHFTLNPRVASRDRSRRVEALRQLKNFVADHARALAAWCRGERTVEFPAGTYWMRVHHHAVCAAPPAPG